MKFKLQFKSLAGSKTKILGAGILGLLVVAFFLFKTSDEIDPPLSEIGSLKPVSLDHSSWLFSWQDESLAAHDVQLIGNFVSEGSLVDRIQMYDNNRDGVWRCKVKLDPGQYAFKYLVNKKIIVSPKEVDVIERTMSGAGQVFVPNRSVPWVSKITPTDESSVRDLPGINFTLSGNLSSLNPSDLRLSLNGKPHLVQPGEEKNEFRVSLNDPDEGQYLLQIIGHNHSGLRILEYQSIFYYQRNPIQEIAQVFPKGVSAYRVLLPALDREGKNGLLELIENLDYLNDGQGNGLGIELLVLYGILPSSDPWGSEIRSYERTKNFGDRQLLPRLAHECRRRGIKLAIHFNLTYISNRHEFFQNSYGNPGSKHWNWFFFLNDIGTRYLSYADDPSLPRLNINSEGAANYLTDIVKVWAASGIDGILCEHADLLPQAWWIKLAESARRGSNNPDFFLIASCHGTGDYFNQLFYSQFNLAESLNHATELALAFAGRDPRGLTTLLSNYERATPRGGSYLRPSSNRELPRLANLSRNKQSHRSALGFLFLGGGIPLLQWGDEFGLRSPEPPLDREPPKLELDQLSQLIEQNHETYHLVKNLIQLRKAWPELNREFDEDGHYLVSWAQNTKPETAIMLRQIDSERFFLVSFNLGQRDNLIRPRGPLPLASTPDGSYRGRRLVNPTNQTHVARIRKGELNELDLPLDSKTGCEVWLFERLYTKDY